MCGIAGFFDKYISDNERVLRTEKMLLQMKHRGPDDQGVWSHSGGLVFGHVRLSILDLSPVGHQPKTSPSKRYTITYNGEIYNFEDLKNELAQLGHTFNGHSDTEVMLSCFDEWGIVESLKRFHGMFSIAIWDSNEKRLFLTRDAIGEKPLYYGWNNGRFFFASELKPLLRYEDFKPVVNKVALHNYLRTFVVPAPLSILEGIKKVPQGCVVCLNPYDSALDEQVESYWDLRSVVESPKVESLSGDEVVEHLETKLSHIIKRQMLSDVPLGAFLSGGVDSSAIVAIMQNLSSKPVNTYTIGFDQAEFDESIYAKEVADHLGTNHTELILSGKDALNVVEDIPRIYDEPFADSSQIPTYLLSKMTRNHVTVSLSGDGGDELFCGYVRYFYADMLTSKMSKLPQSLKRLAPMGINFISEEGWSELYSSVKGILPKSMQVDGFGEKLHKLKNLMQASSDQELYGRLISCWYNEKVVLGISDVPEIDILTNHKDVKLDTLFEKMMFWDSLNYLPNDIMVKVDRASMAVSLETRAPFLDKELVEWVWSIPHQFKLRNSDSKWMLRQLLYKYVPEDMIERPKKGFGIPLNDWLRGELRHWAEDLLSESSLKKSGFLDSQVVREKWLEHKAGQVNWGSHLWAVLMFESWCREYKVSG